MMYSFNPYGYGYGMQPQQPQQNYPQSYQQPQSQTASGGDDRIWVQGEVGAKAYLITPGATVALWDSERPRIYLKSVGPSGMPAMQTLSYTVDSQPAPTPSPSPDPAFETRLSKLEKAFEAFRQEARRNVQQSDADDSSV